MLDKKEINAALKFVEAHTDGLSLSSVDFVKSLRKYFTRNKMLSERQIKALQDISSNLTGPN
jgi:hypothetical protein